MAAASKRSMYAGTQFFYPRPGTEPGTSAFGGRDLTAVPPPPLAHKVLGII